MARRYSSRKFRTDYNSPIEHLEARTLLADVTSAVFDFDAIPNQLRITFDSNVQQQPQASDLRLTISRTTLA